MSAKHTPGLLRIAGRETRGLPHTLVAANTLLFRVYSEAYGDVEQEDANARRLVACWNACHALKTETIEKGGGVFDVLQAVAGQRDELLAALKEARRWIGDGECSDGLAREHWTPEYRAAVDRIDAAITKITGEQP